MEKTLIILKPDCLEAGRVGTVVSRFEEAGFALLGAKMMELDADLLREHYAHIADKPFFPEVEAFMGSRPLLFLVLGGENVIQRVRDLLGPTDSRQADPGTLRGDYGTDQMRNVAHASDSPESADAEIDRFFRADEVMAG
jgi:nucleoside-diphosphate kinase